MSASLSRSETKKNDIINTVEVFLKFNRNMKKTCEFLNVSRSTVYEKLHFGKEMGLIEDVATDFRKKEVERLSSRANKPFTSPEIPTTLPSIEELLEQRKNQFSREDDAARALDLVPVKIKINGPIGILHMGDPHVDDNGTDISKLEKHIKVINDTEGLFGANIGDMQNNWVGRLSHLWSDQSMSSAESWLLVEWLIKSVQWLYLVKGNHDMWTGAGDPLDWMIKGHKVGVAAPNGMRLSLQFPNDTSTRINARHDFPGHSMWNTAHGPARAAQMGWRDSILICGHTHVSGYQVLKDPMTGLISHALRVASYKVYDDFAREKGFVDQNIFCAPITIIDPEYSDNDVRRITTIFDPEEGAEFLTYKRKKWEMGRSR